MTVCQFPAPAPHPHPLPTRGRGGVLDRRRTPPWACGTSLPPLWGREREGGTLASNLRLWRAVVASGGDIFKQKKLGLSCA